MGIFQPLADFFGKILSPSAEAVGERLARGIERYLEPSGLIERSTGDVIFSYKNFDWAEYGKEFWDHFYKQEMSKTEISIAHELQEFLQSLNDPKLVWTFFSGGRILRDRTSVLIGSLEEKGILSLSHFRIVICIAIIVILISISSILSLFRGPYAYASFLDTFYEYLFMLFLPVAAILFVVWKDTRGRLIIRIDRTGKEFYLRRIMPNLVGFIKLNNL